jgi:tetratricopeptide (TPR) repeat protein
VRGREARVVQSLGAVLETFAAGLPWLVAHGAWVGPALLAACVAGGALAGACWTPGAARLLAAWQCANLGGPVRRLEAAMASRPAVVQGVLRFVDGRRCVDLGDGTLVELAGPTRGYLCARGRAPFVIAGDRVRVGGVLERSVAAAARGGYRDVTTRGWRLVPDDEALDMVLFSPRAVLGSPSWRACSALAGAALASLSVCATFQLLGHLGEGDVARLRHGERAYLSELTSLDPSWRDTALQRFERGYRARLQSDEAGEEAEDRLVAVTLLRGDCAGAAQILLQRGRAPLAEALAASCGTPDARQVEAMAAYELGNFREASEAWRRADVRPGADASWWPKARAALRAHILAEAWETAAAEAQRFADADADALGNVRRARLECLASALSAAASGVPRSPGARDPVALHLPCLATPTDGEGGADDMSWRGHLDEAVHGSPGMLAATAMAVPLPDPIALRSSPDGGIPRMAPAHEANLLRALDELPSATARLAGARLALRQAAFEALLGTRDDGRARRWIALARHRLREAGEAARALRDHEQAVRLDEARPHRWVGSGCVRRREPPFPRLPRLAAVPPTQALEDPRTDPGEPPSAEWLEADVPGTGLATALAASLAQTRAAVAPLEEHIAAMTAGLPRLCGSAQRSAVHEMQSAWRQPSADMTALAALRSQARLAEVVEVAAGFDEALRPGAHARLAADRLRDALRATDVGLLVGVVDSL